MAIPRRASVARWRTMAGPGKYGGLDPPPDEAVPEPAPGVVDLADRNLA